MTFTTNELLNLRQALSHEIEKLEERLQLFNQSEDIFPNTILITKNDLEDMKTLHYRLTEALRLV